MDQPNPLRLPLDALLLESTEVGLAAAEAESLTLLSANARLRTWFGLEQGGLGTLDALLPELDRARLTARVPAGRPYLQEVEVARGRRRHSLALRIVGRQEGGRALLLVECRDDSKLRELEYALQSYSTMIEKQNRDLAKQKERVEKVLLNIMPKTVYEEWRQFGVTTPQRYDAASILMHDFVGFTEMAVTGDPPALIGELNEIFTAFDRIVEQFGCERLKTIGDAYLAVSGMPEETPDHAANIAGVALRMRRFLKQRNRTHRHCWKCRIGLNTGPVVGSIVGVQKYVYDIFGPGVNLAARLEHLAEPMEIVISEATRDRLGSQFRVEEIGIAEIKGAGRQRLFRLLGSDDLDEEAPCATTGVAPAT